jgi:ferritin-like metal-binding protein YciE
MMADKDLKELFLHTLKDVYFAEQAIAKALPRMVDGAENPDLADAFTTHLEQTQGQITRLQQVFELVGTKAEGVPCEAIQGILKEGDEVAEKFQGGPALDAGLIAAAQAVEHYEIARYGVLVAWAEKLDLADVADLLEETLMEEKETDKLLTELAEGEVNDEAET